MLTYYLAKPRMVKVRNAANDLLQWQRPLQELHVLILISMTHDSQ